MKNTLATSISAYIRQQPRPHQPKLKSLHELIKKVVPAAEETISYRMPAYRFYGILVYFCLHKNHIGFYPLPSAIREFKSELADYVTSKGAIQFPLNKPLPVKLIRAIVRFRAEKNRTKAEEAGLVG